MALKLSDVVINAVQTLGGQFLCVDVKPYNAYVVGADGKKAKTEAIEGYKYTIVLLDRLYEKVDIKIPGAQRITLTDKKAQVPVKMEGLDVKAYQEYNTPQKAINFTISAIGIVEA